LQTRICFQVASTKDSLLVVHEEGAEKLKVGEFLYKSPTSTQIKRIKV
jgi:DNA segregation ATPase FtsK/SpoIIIE-like protein